MTEYQWTDGFENLSGNVNPLHVDHDYAAHVGLVGPVIFGMMSSSLYSRLVGVCLPPDSSPMTGIDIPITAGSLC